jgi:hypothetical protein
LFATTPSVVKDDYAKWMLDDLRVNFAISTRGRYPGLDHLGIQVESEAELQDVYARLRNVATGGFPFPQEVSTGGKTARIELAILRRSFCAADARVPQNERSALLRVHADIFYR